MSIRGDRGEESVRDVSFTVRAGEILGVAGVAGNGQRELAEAVTGMRPALERFRRCRTTGSCRTGDPRAAISAGIAHVPEDRLGTGVAPGLSIAENSVLKSYRLRGISRGPLLNWGMIRERRARPDPALRRRDSRAAAPSARPLRRQPAEARPRPRVLQRPEGADRRLADAGPRRRRDRDGARLPAPGRRRGRRGAADQRGPRRDPRAGRPGRWSCTRGSSPASSIRARRRSRRSGCAMAGGRASDRRSSGG